METVLIKLGVLSKIRPGQTIALRDGKIVILNHDTIEGVIRYMKGENRTSCEYTISSTITTAIEYTTLLIESTYLSARYYDEMDPLYIDTHNKRVNELGRLRVSMENSIVGISQLSSTYKTDENMLEKLNAIKGDIIYQIKLIDSKLAIIKSKHTK